MKFFRSTIYLEGSKGKRRSTSDLILKIAKKEKPMADTNTQETQSQAEQGKVVTNPPKDIEPKAPAHMVSAKEIRTSFFDPVVWEQMKGMAETFRASGAFPAEDNTPKLLVKLQAGREMGMTPVESIKSFYFVNGQINIFGAATMRRLREHGWSINFKDTPNACTATITKGKEKYSDTLTFEEAEKSGWTKGGAQGYLKAGWKEGANRKLKLRYGAVSLLIKTYVPEVLGSAVDIAEVAMDAMPVSDAYKAQITGGDEPAKQEVIDSIKTMGGVLPDDVESGERQLTKQEAADMIKQLTVTKKRAKKQEVKE